MKTIPTSLPGVIVIELDVFQDARGWFMETFRRDRYRELGIAVGMEFVQDNLSSSVAGTLRGLHYQLRQAQGKLVQVTRGEVFDVAVDIRVGSPTFGAWFGTLLSAANHRQMWIPPGFAHGFLATSSEVEYGYKVTASYAPADERSLAWNDPELAIAWPLAGTPTLSKRDSEAPGLRTAELPVFVR
jgi:dTDP-4-dehydrorhamnose 3,5-epimerase